MTTPGDVLARYLAQRQELGERELFLSPELGLLLRGKARAGGTAAARPSEPQDTSPVRQDPRGGESSRQNVEEGRPPRLGRNSATAGSAASGTLHAPRPTSGAISGKAISVQPAAIPAGAGLVHLGSLPEVATVAGSCTACGLARTRSTVVFGDGNPQARLVVVGEAPGADEDREGRPFVGRAGKLLDLLLASVGFPRPDVYICNVLKCRPPQNRNPLPDEVHSCSPFLRRQLELIGPRAILAVGTFPAQTLLNTTESISRLRGIVHDYGGIPLVPTYHPAALLRNSSWIRPVWEDLQKLRTILDP